MSTAPVILSLPYPPSANRNWRRYGGKIVKSDESRRYCGIVLEMVRRQVAEPLTGPLSLMARVFRPRKAGDIDNSLKVLLDALQGAGAFQNDNQIEELHVYRNEDPKDPRVEVEIREIKN